MSLPEESALASAGADLAQEQRRLKTNQGAFETLRLEKCRGFPWLARAYADHIHLQDTRVAGELRTKAHPAIRSAQILQGNRGGA